MTSPLYVPLPLALLALVDLGRLPPTDFTLICALSLEAQAARKDGLVFTSAPALAARWGFGLKATRAAIVRLEADGRLKSFHRQGVSGKYWMAVDGFLVVRNGTVRRLDARGTTDPGKPRLVLCVGDIVGSVRAAPAAGAQKAVSLPDTDSGEESDRGGDGGSPQSLDIETRDSPLPPVETAEPKRGGGGGEATATGSVGASRRTSDSIAQLIALWRSLAAAKGQVGECSYRDHAKTFAALLVVRGSDVEACLAAVRAYFADDDEFIVKSGWSIGVFAARMRGYSPAPKPRPVAPPQSPQHAEPPASKEQAADFADQIRRLFPNRGNTQ